MRQGRIAALFIFLFWLSAAFQTPVFAGEIQRVVATYLCGSVKLGFAIRPKNNELVVYYHTSKNVGVMTTDLKVEKSFDLVARTVVMTDSLCTYRFQNQKISASNCDSNVQFVPSGTCNKL